MEKLFNILPSEIRSLNRVSMETLKRRLDKWPRAVLDEPRINNYVMYLAAENNNIVLWIKQDVWWVVYASHASSQILS